MIRGRPSSRFLEHLDCHRLMATEAWRLSAAYGPTEDSCSDSIPRRIPLSMSRGAFRRKLPPVRGDRSPRPSDLVSRHAAPKDIATERTGAFIRPPRAASP